MLFGLLRLRPNPVMDRLELACCLRTQQGVWMVSVRADRGRWTRFRRFLVGTVFDCLFLGTLAWCPVENRSGHASTHNFSRWVLRSLVRNRFLLESLILAQDERWRRASHMQVERKGPLAGTRVANG